MSGNAAEVLNYFLYSYKADEAGIDGHLEIPAPLVPAERVASGTEPVPTEEHDPE